MVDGCTEVRATKPRRREGLEIYSETVGLVDILFVLVVDLAPRPLFVVVAVPVDKHDRVCLVRLGRRLIVQATNS